MRAFDYIRASGSAEDVVGTLDDGTRPYAGGTDLLTRMKLGITTPERLVDIKGLDLPADIRSTDEGLALGALTTLADIERHAFEPAHALLAEAASRAATPQLRERATLGGNLLQRPRCWYYRDPDVPCWLKGGDTCPARDGRNEQHAILGNGPRAGGRCVAVHPSDLATCLTALEAVVTLSGPDGARTLGIDALFAEPEDDRRHETVLAPDELVHSIRVPSAGEGSSVYLKAMERKVWAFALVGVAAVATPANGGGSTLRLAASGVASIPWRLGDVETRLAEVAPDDDAGTDAAIEAGLVDASPLSGNAYKVALLRRLVRQAVDGVRPAR